MLRWGPLLASLRSNHSLNSVFPGHCPTGTRHISSSLKPQTCILHQCNSLLKLSRNASNRTTSSSRTNSNGLDAQYQLKSEPRTSSAVCIQVEQMPRSQCHIQDTPTSLETAITTIQSVFGVPPNSHGTLSPGMLASSINMYGSRLLCRLSTNEISELLKLLGTISDSSSPFQYRSRYARMNEASSGTYYWKEMLKVVEMREELGHHSKEGEDYWSMRVYLESVKAGKDPYALERAITYHSHFSRECSDSLVHVPFFDVLLFHKSGSKNINVLDEFIALLKVQATPHPRLVTLLWNVLLLQGAGFSQETKLSLVNLFTHRLAFYNSFMTQASEETISTHPTIQDFMGSVEAIFFPYPRHNFNHLSSWALQRAHEITATELSVNERFTNLTLLAKWRLPHLSANSHVSHPIGADLEWRTIFGISVVQSSLSSQSCLLGQDEIGNMARTLWRQWKSFGNDTRPLVIERVVLSVFFIMSGILKDKPLLDACAEYASSRRLWTTCSSNCTQQIEQLFVSYATGLTQCHNPNWAPLLSNLIEHCSELSLARVLCIIFFRLKDQPINHVQHLYVACKSARIPVPPECLLPLVETLACQEQWESVLPLLDDPSLGCNHSEQILTIILESLRSTRREFISPTFAKTVGEAIQKLYMSRTVPKELKYPVRFIIPIMIVSQQARQAVDILEMLFDRNPTLFTPRYLIRIIRALTSHGQPGLVNQVLGMIPSPELPASHDLRRKTIQHLLRVGAFGLARRITCKKYNRGARDRLAYLNVGQPRKCVKLALLRFIPFLLRQPIHGSTVLNTTQFLARQRHLSMARYLLERTHKTLKAVDLTAVCNTYLHGLFFRRRLRNGRLVRYVFHTKDFLAKRYGFIPDRTTANILIKAILKWKTRVTSRMIKSLFDHLIRNKYPASERWRTSYGVPFGTPAENTLLDFTTIQQSMSFKKHVRPLYKMFIKALFLRGDRRAAHRVIGILKEEEVLAIQRKEEREQVRRLGIIKKLRRQRALKGQPDEKTSGS